MIQATGHSRRSIRLSSARAKAIPRWVNWASPVAFILLWQLLAQTNLLDQRIIAPPTTIATTLVTMFTREHFLSQVGFTLMRFLGGLLVGVLPGTLIGLTMGLFRWPRAILEPLISMLYPLPHIALFPIILILVGLNERSNLLMVALGPFFTMVIVSATAVRNIEPIYLDVAESFETDLRDLYARVVFPAVLPTVAGGFRISLGLGLVSAIAVEFLVADNGIGHVIWNSWQILSLSRSVAGLAVTGIIGFIAFGLCASFERRIIPWEKART
jgi:ABC-type nitrate/sulfonate/bicarbonate transport system permease component